MQSRKFLVVLLSMLVSYSASASVSAASLQIPSPQTPSLTPTQTGIPNYVGVENDSHLVAYDDAAINAPQSIGKGKLLVFLPGSSILGTSDPANFFNREFVLKASRLGFVAIGLDYENNARKVPSCVGNGDVCARVRLASRVDGNGRRNVGPDFSYENSVEERLRKLLLYLRDVADPSGSAQWAKYLQGGATGSEIDWSQIVISGHSLGAGVAAFIGKSHTTAGVALISGPCDFLTGSAKSWMSSLWVSSTPVSRWAGLQNPFDFICPGAPATWGSHKSGASVEGLGIPKENQLISWKPSPWGPHVGPITKVYEAEWKELLLAAGSR